MSTLEQLFNNENQSIMYTSRPEYPQEIVKNIIRFWQKFNDEKIEKSLKIVDIGCGTGQLTNLLIPYAESLIGLDSSESQIKLARTLQVSQDFPKYIEKNLKIVDIGCGTGQLTNLLIPYAESLIGLDSSESQIKLARTLHVSQDFPKYIVGECYNIPVSEKSVDLITAGQCVHWFDIDKFYAEVDRCLKLNGVLAIVTYGKGYFVMDGDQDAIGQLNKFVAKDLWFDDKYLSLYYSDKPRWAWNLLPGLRYLYPNTAIRNDKLHMEFPITLKRYRDYLYSTSMYQAWKKSNPSERDIVEMAMEKILNYLNNPPSGLETQLPIRFPLCLIMCSKPR